MKKKKNGRAANAPDEPAPAEVSRRTLRLTFAYEASRIELVSQMRVEKITPPSVTPCPDPKTAAGYWVELRDKRGRCLFHRLLPDAIRDSAEIYPEGKPMARAQLREVKGRFEVLFPDVPEADSVVVMGHPIAAHGLMRHERCSALATIKLSREGVQS